MEHSDIKPSTILIINSDNHYMQQTRGPTQVSNREQWHTSCMWTVGDNRKNVLQDVCVVCLIKALGSCVICRNVLQHLIEYRETSIRDIPHCVFEGPYDRVQHQLELLRRDGQKCCYNTASQTIKNGS